MADSENVTGAKMPPQIYEMGGSAPFVYFDVAPSYGVMDGVVQVELGARVMTPRGDGTTAIKVVSCGRLRCSAQAAAFLRDVLDGSLKMLEQQASQLVASKLN